LKALEEARQAKFIGTSLEARVRLAGAQLDDYADDMPALFIVSQVDLEPGNEVKVTVERAAGVKCERCWKYSVFPGPVCDSCADALKEMQG
jgi:isoleucyl-tRNA synthetase